jgi:hypothetical protein
MKQILNIILKLIKILIILSIIVFLLLLYLLDFNMFEYFFIYLKHIILSEKNEIFNMPLNNITNIYYIHSPLDDTSSISASTSTASSSTTTNADNNPFTPLKDSVYYKPSEGAKITVSPETVSKVSDKIIDNLPNISSTVASGIATGAGGTGAMMAATRLVKNTPLPVAAKAGIVIGMGTAGAAGVSLGSQIGSAVGKNVSQYLESQVDNSPFNQTLPDDRAPSPNPEFSVNSMLDSFELSN